MTYLHIHHFLNHFNAYSQPFQLMIPLLNYPGNLPCNWRLTIHAGYSEGSSLIIFHIHLF